MASKDGGASAGLVPQLEGLLPRVKARDAPLRIDPALISTVAALVAGKVNLATVVLADRVRVLNEAVLAELLAIAPVLQLTVLVQLPPFRLVQVPSRA